MSVAGRNNCLDVRKWRHGILTGLVVLAMAVVFNGVVGAASAQAETRTLKLYNTHTREQADITFKRNGKYVQSGLRELNRFLRDHRRNEPTRMDPALFDLVWEVYQASGARNRIHIVSGYRSPATNDMLRRTRGGQARKSQHMVGKAMDFFIPGVSAQKLRELGFKLQGGGVGYYPRSGTPYVHLDTGNVRAWPRMSRQELTRLFPDGRTLHIPPDGKRLPGYQQALAAYNERQRSGTPPSFNQRGSSGGLLAGIFGNGRDRDSNDDQPAASRQTASAPAAPAPQRQSPEAPRVLLASLPASSIPTPTSAPRSAPASVEQATEQPVIIPPPPQARPAVLVAAAEPPALRQSASALEDSVAGNDAAAILAALGVQENADGATTELAYAALPIPTRAPRLDGNDAQTVAAVAPSAATAIPSPADPLRGSASDRGKGGRIAVPADRPQIERPVLGAALEDGAATTPKAARPTFDDALAARPKLIPADQINPARFGDWPTTHASLAHHDRQVTAPQFVMNAGRARAGTVLNAGFTKTPAPDPNRFSGGDTAATRLAASERLGGDGRALTLDIPTTN